MRYFRTATAVTYEAIRAQFDAAYGYPNPETKTLTAIPPAGEAPTDTSARVYLVASQAECEYPAVAAMLPTLLSSGAAEEVTAAEYAEQFPSPLPA